MNRTYYVGGDAHKDFVTVTVMWPNGKKTECFNVPATPSGMDEIIAHMGKKTWCYMAETSTYSIDLHRYLLSREADAILVDPCNLKLITDGHKKTDENDSFVIAQFLRLYKRGEIALSISTIVQDRDLYLRERSRTLERYSSQRGRTVLRIKAHLRKNAEYVEERITDNLDNEDNRKRLRDMFSGDATLADLLDDYEYCTSKCTAIESELNTFVRRQRNIADGRIKCQDPQELKDAVRYTENIALLQTIPGIALRTAVQLQSAIVDIDRFASADKMRSFYGMAPNVRNSGGKVNHGHITKQGDPMVRTILSRVGSVMVRSKDGTRMKEYHDSHVQSMGKKKTRIAVANKVLDIIYSVLKRRSGFVPY